MGMVDYATGYADLPPCLISYVGAGSFENASGTTIPCACMVEVEFIHYNPMGAGQALRVCPTSPQRLH